METGYWKMENVLNSTEMDFLRHECKVLLENTPNLIENGCVLDIFQHEQIDDDMRMDQDLYLKVRNRMGIEKESTIRKLIFEKLPTLIAHQLGNTFKMYLFNEHYVVKPKHSDIEFRWHRDGDEQLAMCCEKPVYYSLWCPLDDIHIDNGGLVLEPLLGRKAEHYNPRMKAGDAMLFQSNVWHCSKRNNSDLDRRVFYIQYSTSVIKSRNQDVFPLAFGIQCPLSM